MLPGVRKNAIKEIILEKKNANVLELSKIFSVTSETIRRDLKDLEIEGIIERTHGGAILKEKVINFTSKELKNIFLENKNIISNLVLPFIKNNYCVFLDASTTVQNLAGKLKHVELTVVTNSLDNANILSEMKNIKLIFLGGSLSNNGNCFVGSITRNILEDFYFDMTLFSCRSLTESEIMDSDYEEASIKRLAIKKSKSVVLMADYSKFDKLSFTNICDIDKINYLVTDKTPSKVWLESLKKNNIKCIYSDLV